MPADDKLVQVVTFEADKANQSIKSANANVSSVAQTAAKGVPVAGDQGGRHPGSRADAREVVRTPGRGLRSGGRTGRREMARLQLSPGVLRA